MEGIQRNENPLISQRVDSEQQVAALAGRKTNPIELLRNWIFEANQAKKWVSEENWLEMKSFLKKFG
jgi:hypothetical protein